jgi:hypothetical protein
MATASLAAKHCRSIELMQLSASHTVIILYQLALILCYLRADFPPGQVSATVEGGAVPPLPSWLRLPVAAANQSKAI